MYKDYERKLIAEKEYDVRQADNDIYIETEKAHRYSPSGTENETGIKVYVAESPGPCRSIRFSMKVPVKWDGKSNLMPYYK